MCLQEKRHPGGDQTTDRLTTTTTSLLFASWWRSRGGSTVRWRLLSGQLNLKSCYVSDEPAGPPSPSLPPSLPLSLSFSPSLHYSCLVHAWVWGDCALDSAIGLSSSLAKYGSSMGVPLRRNTSDMLTGDILTHFFSFTNLQENALNSKNEIS